MSELAIALAKFHENLPSVGKGSTNAHFGSKYADLADIVKVVLPALAAQGLTWIARPTFTDNGFVLAYELRHATGESVTGEWPLPDPEKANPQVLGSAVTYAKRFALSAVTGIAPDTDDDGNGASAAGAPTAAARPATATEMRKRIDTASTALTAAVGAEAVEAVWANIEKSGLDQQKPLTELIAKRRAEFPKPDVTEAWAAKQPGEG